MENEITIKISKEEIDFIINCMEGMEIEYMGSSKWNDEDEKMLKTITAKLRENVNGK